ncbi:hypothetical protein ACHAXA_003707 [Cyclostephanos tholiformis]|uniref:Vitamin K epoxide reductase domain-containing protein n=1 Tax=Cyclostephanos tholiformis TaxID=382380 RepID=A0ABD3RZ75_9STRA
MQLLKALIAQGAASGFAFAPPSPLWVGFGSLHNKATNSHVRTKTSASPPRSSTLSRIPTASRRESPSNDNSYDVDPSCNELSTCWNPNLRYQLGVISAMGSLETAYLTYDKAKFTSGGKTSSLVVALCSTNDNGGGSCGDILHGPYSTLHLGGLDVPLSALGMAAYILIFGLTTFPLFVSEKNAVNGKVLNGGNRIALLGGTTLMASFSMYLVALLVKVLHASCLFCFVSAGLSTSMASLSWFGGMLPNIEEMQSSFATESTDIGQFSNEVLELRKKGIAVGASSIGIATVMALVLFFGVAEENGNSDSLLASSSSSSSISGGMLVASASSSDSYRKNVPPRITTKSSDTALALASDLKSLESRMFGAFWCSHCYDQKQELGYEAMKSIPYVECDREGYNNERDLCKEKKVPGYPTWEIGGKLYPGERSLEELREIVDDIKSRK